MRRIPHAPGSDAAQQTLLNMAGWTPNRRSFVSGLIGMLALGAAPAVAAITDTVPEATCASAPASVSPRMAALIAELMRRNAIVDGLSTEAEVARWDDAGQDLSDAMTALVNERPATLADFAAKLTTLAEVTPDDACDYPLRRLAEDVTFLVGEAQ